MTTETKFTFHVFITGELLHFPLTPRMGGDESDLITRTAYTDKQGAVCGALAEIERASGLGVSAEVEVRRLNCETDRSQRLFLFTCKATRITD